MTEQVKKKTKKRVKLLILVVILHTLFSIISLYAIYRVLYSSEPKIIQISEEATLQFAGGNYYFPLNLHLNQIDYKAPHLEIHEDILEIHINPLAFISQGDHFITLYSHSPFIRMESPPPDSLQNTPADSSTLPQSLDIELPTIPFPFKLMVDDLYFFLDEELYSSFDKLRIYQNSLNRLQLHFYDLQAIPGLDSLEGHIAMDWNRSDSLDLLIQVYRGLDTLDLTMDVPQKNLSRAQAEVYLKAGRMLDSLPLPAIPGVPDTLSLEGLVGFDLPEREPYGQIELYLKSGPKGVLDSFPMFLNGEFKVNAQYSPEGFETYIEANAPTKEKAVIEGSGTLKASDWNIQFSGWSIQLGGKNVPAEALISPLKIRGDSLHLKLKTSAGTELWVDGNLKQLPKASFHGQYAAQEPWALIWTDDNMVINGGTLKGIYDGNLLKATVTAGGPNIYGMNVDSALIEAELASDFILFPYLQINSGGVRFEGDGEVNWRQGEEFYRFQLNLGEESRVGAFGKFGGLFSAQVSAFPLQALPFNNMEWAKGLDTKVTGRWNTHFEPEYRIGEAYVNLEGTYQNLPLDIDLWVRENRDTTTIDSINIRQGENQLQGAALLYGGLQAPVFKRIEITTENLDLAPLSTLIPLKINGKLSGYAVYNSLGEDPFFNAKLSMDSLQGADTNQVFFNFQNPEISASGDSAFFFSRFKGGRLGQWDGEFGLQTTNLFGDSRKIDLALATDRDGLLILDGFWNSQLETRGTLQARGPWYTFADNIDVLGSDLEGNFIWNLKEGTKGIKANIPKANLSLNLFDQFAIKTEAKAALEHGVLQTEATLIAQEETSANFSLNFDLLDIWFQKMRIQSDSLVFYLKDSTRITAKDFIMGARQNRKELAIPLKASSVSFNWNHPTIGNLYGRTGSLKGSFNTAFGPNSSSNIPPLLKVETGMEKFIFKKMDYPEINTEGLFKGVEKGQLFSGLQFSKRNSMGIQTRGIDLDLRVTDAGKDSIRAVTNVYNVPFTFDLSISGNMNNMLFRGSMNNIDDGTLEVLDDKFKIQNLQINWDGEAFVDGDLYLGSEKTYPYCEEVEQAIDEECPIQMNARGQLSNFQLQPEANCGSSGTITPNQLFVGIFIGCVSRDEESDYNALTEKFTEKALKYYANKWIFKEIGGFDRDVIKGFEYSRNNQESATDSSSFFISTIVPFVDSRDLLLKFGRVWNTGEEIDFDSYTKLAINLNLLNGPAKTGILSSYFPDTESPHIWSIEAAVVSKDYYQEINEGGTETAIEANIGLQFERSFWDFCLFGFGDCNE